MYEYAEHITLNFETKPLVVFLSHFFLFISSIVALRLWLIYYYHGCNSFWHCSIFICAKFIYANEILFRS